jgi:uncharacterized membrane protein YGL010W
MDSNFFDRFFRDANGEIVIAQMPNVPIIVWLVATLAKLAYPTGKINVGLNILASSSLLVWSLGELTQGVTYFRRSLGLVVLIWLIATTIQQVYTARLSS